MIRPDRPLAETLEPRLLLATFTVTSNANTGAGTLRQAITSANLTVEADVIAFNLPGTTATARRIQPTTPLPEVTAPLTIDGTTQPGYAPGAPVVQLIGNAIGLSFRNAGDVVVRGLSITNATTGIRIVGGRTAVIEGNWIGPAPDRPNNASGSTGVAVVGAAGVRIGGTTPQTRNVIATTGVGVRIGADSADNLPTRGVVVAGNYVGTTPDGLAVPVFGGMQAGVLLAGGAEANLIGGTEAGARNVIGGCMTGVALDASSSPQPQTAPRDNRLEGNWIGLNAVGTAVPNGDGVVVKAGATNNVIGGTAPGARNVISGNNGAGIRFAGAQANRVEGNWIGVDAVTGTAAVRNNTGVRIDAAGGGAAELGGSNIIGGTAPGARNVISGNYYGLWISSPNNRVLGNYIGTNAAGTFRLTTPSPFPVYGVFIVGDQGSTIDVSGNEIGGAAPGEGNLISGNDRGVATRGSNARGTKIAGNLIGLNAAGNALVGNDTYGVFLSSSGNVVGLAAPDSPPGARNVIAGNHDGVHIESGNDNVVRGNYVGTDATGTIALGNRSTGIIIDPPVGTTPPPMTGNVIESNVVAANYAGMVVFDFGGSTRVAGNYIGTNAAGTAALPNVTYGLLVLDSGNMELVDNLISGNGANGVELSSPPKRGTMSGNRIGLGATGQPLGNGGHGLAVFSRPNAPGDSISITGNTIAYNGGSGIYVFNGRHALWDNSIYSNGGLGIDLEPVGVNPNDDRTDASKTNSALDHPIITAVYPSGDKTVVLATLSGLTQGDIAFLKFSLSPEADPSGFGEGAERLPTPIVGSLQGADGLRHYAYTFDRLLPAGQFLTATATRTVGTTIAETSEFSPAFRVPPPDANLPRVARVYVPPGEFSTLVGRHMESSGLGSSEQGYAIPDGAAQSDTLPWASRAAGSSQSVWIQFTEPVDIKRDAPTLTVRGVGGRQYPAQFEAYNSRTFSGLWVVTLPEGDRADRLTLELDATGAAGVTDFAGNALDGEWADGADAYPSGDGSAGGDFRFSVNLLTGDADRRGGRVNAQDLAEVKRHLNSTAAGGGAVAYSVFADLDGNGTVNAQDLTIVRRNLNRSLPPAPAVAPAPPALAAATASGLPDDLRVVGATEDLLK